jgi:probable F420-dependent oxidoreductase
LCTLSWFTAESAVTSKHPLRVGIKLSQNSPIDAYRHIWQIADEAGFDHCWAFDHLATIGPIGEDGPVFDGWTLLAALAVVTSRVRMGLQVTGVTYRNPALLAKIATTVDHLSNGRVEFAIGAAWATNEHEMYGIPGLDHRVGLLSEALQAIKGLWTQDRTSLDGRYVKMREAIANPKPVQKPHPPIWIGAGGPSTLRIAARYADVWSVAGQSRSDPDAASDLSKQFDAACEGIGRNPAEVRRSTQIGFGGDPAQTLDVISRFYELGFSELVVMVGPYGFSVGSGDPARAAELVAERVLPEVRKLSRPHPVTE